MNTLSTVLGHVMGPQQMMPELESVGLGFFLFCGGGGGGFVSLLFYLFIWLHWVLVAARGIFFFLSCGMWALSCRMRDLVP